MAVGESDISVCSQELTHLELEPMSNMLRSHCSASEDMAMETQNLYNLKQTHSAMPRSGKVQVK